MTLQIYNTASRKKEVFKPLDPTNVRMYVCGPTVYDFAHIGNARPVVIFDVLYRLLQRLYPKVTYVRNITDVDDKINTRSQESGEDIRSLTERTAQQFHADVAALGALPPDVEPRATEHIAEMIDIIETLIAKGHAYAADGHVLFNVPSMADYGKLSGHSRDELIAGARVDVAPYKKDPADFVLWKPSDDDLPGWESPWGRGRPGWHIECSAMSEKHLGASFDIHGGGNDLIFPHHENEIAQSRCAHPDAIFAKYWMHNGYLMVEGEKMSKSLGNFFTINELLQEYPGEALRLALLQTHYRQPLDFTKSGVEEAKRILIRFYGALHSVAGIPATDGGDSAVLAALEDDLNTPLAIAALHAALGELNKATTDADKARYKGELLTGGAVLGLLQADPEEWLKGRAFTIEVPVAAQPSEPFVTHRVTLDDEAINEMIAQRKTARESRDYSKADRIRDKLAEDGIVVLDKPDGTTDWRRS